MAPATRANFTADDLAKVKVGAYYYPWYGDDFHRGGGYVRKYIGQTPTLGEYNDSEPAIVRQHLEYSRLANIELWVSSWWGRYSREDNTTRNVILPILEEDKTNHKLAILYESTGRLKFESGNRQIHRVTADIEFILDNYVSHPNYYHIRGRPVVFIYLSRVLELDNDLASVLLLMRTAAARRNMNLYIVGDHSFGKPPAEEDADEYLPFNYLDAITNYDVYGTLPKPYAGSEGVRTYYHQQAVWREQARKQECKFIPSVSPGFNDRGIRIEVNHTALSRKLNNASDEFGSFFEYTLRKALPQVDRGADRLILVNSFNEWHEDTQIEPVNGTLTTEPENYTQGVEYEAYGTRYLDILHEMTTNGSWIAEEQEEIAWLEQLELEMEGRVEKEEEEEEEEKVVLPTRPIRKPVTRPTRPTRQRTRKHDAFDDDRGE
jgi:glycoprotein endo-alpha-1,2-mannosidase